jgi:hypothetical protein
VKVSLGTALVWAKKLGLEYMSRKKSYYVDNHDRADVLLYRDAKYLPEENALELQQYVWAQMTVAEFTKINAGCTQEELKEKGLLFDLGDGRVEVHVDILPVWWRKDSRFSATVNNFNMGGRLSERKPAGALPIIKVGFDETVFKMYQMNRSAWEMDGVKLILRKTEGKGVMYAVFKDEVCGFAYNQLSQQQWDKFKAHRATMNDELGQTLYPQPGMHLHVYGANDEGYWTADHMVALTKEFMILFEWLYPDHQLLLNVDWSSNHNAIAPDALTLSNLNVGWGGKNARELLPKRIQEGCVNSNRLDIPERWREKMTVGQEEKFVFVRGDDPPFYDPGATDFVGKPIGLKELLYRRGLWKVGMTRHGGKGRRGRRRGAAAGADEEEDTIWKKDDLVYRLEPTDDGGEELALYKIREVPPEHRTVSDDAFIKCQYFATDGNTHTLTKHWWDNFKASSLSDLPLKNEYITKGRITNYRCKITGARS